MKILHIPTGGLLSDGILSCILAYVGAMERSDMEIVILAVNEPQPELVEKIEDMDCRVAVIPYRRSNVFRYTRMLYRYLKQNRFDIVHVHGSSAIMAVELLAARLAGCRVRIAHSHNTMCDSKKADRLLRPLFYHLYTHAFACGQEAGQWLFPGRKFTVVQNGRDLDRFQYDENARRFWRERLDIGENCLAIGHVGRFTRLKNHAYIIEMLQAAKERRTGVKLVLMGEGRLLEETKELVRAKHLEEDVCFLGNVDNVHEILSAMDVMVLPSIYEGLPLVVLEWQAEGLPCYISDTVTEECIVRDNVKKLSILEAPEVWAEAVINTELSDRWGMKEEIRADMREKGYDIVCAAQKLKQMYRQFVYGEEQ